MQLCRRLFRRAVRRRGWLVRAFAHAAKPVGGSRVVRFLSDYGLRTQRYGKDKVSVEECPFCHPINGMRENMYKMVVWLQYGTFYCHRCGSKGGFRKFQQAMADLVKQGKIEPPASKEWLTVQNNASSGKSRGANRDHNHHRHIPVAADVYENGDMQGIPVPEDVLGGERKSANSPPPLEGIHDGSPRLPKGVSLNSASDTTDGREGPNAQTLRPERLQAFRQNLLSQSSPVGGEVLKMLCGTGDVSVRPYADNDRRSAESVQVKGRGLHRDVLQRYGVGAGVFQFPNNKGQWVSERCVVFPLTGKDGRTVRLKVRSSGHKHHQRMLPKGAQEWGFFGLDTVPADAPAVVLTEGEYDAMACFQATGMPSISLPNGAQHLPPNAIPLLSRFSTIYIWTDDDGPGQEAAVVFARKLGVDRCRIVRNYLFTEETPGYADVIALDGSEQEALDSANYRAEAGVEDTLRYHKAAKRNRKTTTPEQSASLSDGSQGPKDANEALLAGVCLKRMLRNARLLPHSQITDFDELREEVFRQFAQPDAYQGVQYKTFGTLNRLLKGHRRGELTIVTGGTGVGKTTILSQLSLDLASQGVTTLWGSFEISNPRLLKVLLSQYAGANLFQNLHLFPGIADRFSQLPLHFLRFHGSTPISKVVDAMEYAVYVHDVQHIVIDNLQFMLSMEAEQGPGKNSYSRMLSRSSFDKFELQDRMINILRKFASKQNVHVTLVIHPRKEMESQRLGINSVFGTAKATQEADNVVILQKLTHKRAYDLGLTDIPPSKPGAFGQSEDEPEKNEADAMFDSNSDAKEKAEAEDAVSFEDFRLLEVKKNRWDGTLGSVPIRYERDSQRIVDIFWQSQQDEQSEQSDDVDCSTDADLGSSTHTDLDNSANIGTSNNEAAPVLSAEADAIMAGVLDASPTENVTDANEVSHQTAPADTVHDLTPPSVQTSTVVSESQSDAGANDVMMNSMHLYDLVMDGSVMAGQSSVPVTASAKAAASPTPIAPPSPPPSTKPTHARTQTSLSRQKSRQQKRGRSALERAEPCHEIWME